MDVKKNLMLWLTVFALALPLLITGTASAKYMGDGAVQDGVTGGWILPTDFVCIVGLRANGTLDIADGVTDRHTCQYLTKGTMNGGTPFDLSSMTTSAACINAGGSGNDGAKHAFATSICVDGTGKGLSLAGVDRTYSMCVAKGGTWKQTSATAPYPGAPGTFPTPGFTGTCAAYGAQFKGQNASGTPSAFGTKGTTAGTDGQGFCYTTLNMTTSYGTSTVAGGTSGLICPAGSTNASTAYDWAWSSPKCTYSKGIAGYLNAALTKADGTTTAAGTFVDLSTITTMGECLAAGASWNNWVGVPGSTTSIGTTPLASTIPAWNYVTQAPDADNGCLHCHSTAVQYNGPAERWKDSYLKTGHKNMLRKVTAGKNWAGPDGVVYTTDGTNTINFTTGTTNVGGTDRTLYYVYGDWMAALPTTVYSNLTGTTNGYSCGACHTTGYRDSSNPGTQTAGTPGFGTTGIEPQASFPGIDLNPANPKWDLDGIQCARCHNAAVPAVSAAMITANTPGFATTAPMSGGMGALASGTGRTNLCFGCHQSIAKKWPAQGGASGGTTQYDPTLIPTGINHGASQGRDFNGHVLGNSFLNSPHSRYTGTIQLNLLGKFDLSQPNGTTQYSSAFQGFTCWQSPTTNSPAKTKADGTEIKTKAECETLYGAGSWRADASGDLGTKQGSCATCHDVHNSMFVASQEEAAMRKTCADCHANNVSTGATITTLPQISKFNHPSISGTPFDGGRYPEGPCVVCHMATQAIANGNQNSMAAHVWRINTSPAYNTFPTAAQWNAADATKDRNAQTSPETYTAPGGGTSTFTNAVWVDLDMACGQCHGGSLGAGATANGAPYFDKTGLGNAAKDMHLSDWQQTVTATPSFVWSASTTTSYLVNFNAASTICPIGYTCSSYAWDFGDSITGTGVTTSHTYSAGTATFNAKLTVTVDGFSVGKSIIKTVSPVFVNHAPVAAGLMTGTTSLNPAIVTNATNAVSFTDASSDADGNILSVSVNWGDGTVDTQVAAGGVFTHSYTRASKFAIIHTVRDTGGKSNVEKAYVKIVPPKYVISGAVSVGGTNVSGVFVSLKFNGRTKAGVTTTSGLTNYTFPSQLPGSYTMTLYKRGCTFSNPGTINLTADTTVNITGTCP